VIEAPELRFSLPADLFEAIAARAAELVRSAHGGGYMTPKQAAAYLACEPRRIYKLKRSGRLRTFKEGGRLLLLRSDLDALLEEQPPS
jgi:excisionase family DNA binding protein